jgi:hypothetical protein
MAESKSSLNKTMIKREHNTEGTFNYVIQRHVTGNMNMTMTTL